MNANALTSVCWRIRRIVCISKRTNRRRANCEHSRRTREKKRLTRRKTEFERSLVDFNYYYIRICLGWTVHVSYSLGVMYLAVFVFWMNSFVWILIEFSCQRVCVWVCAKHTACYSSLLVLLCAHFNSTSCAVDFPCARYLYLSGRRRLGDTSRRYEFFLTITWYSLERNLRHFSFALQYRSLLRCHKTHTYTETHTNSSERARSALDQTNGKIAKILLPKWHPCNEKNEAHKINLFMIWIYLASFRCEHCSRCMLFVVVVFGILLRPCLQSSKLSLSWVVILVQTKCVSLNQNFENIHHLPTFEAHTHTHTYAISRVWQSKKKAVVERPVCNPWHLSLTAAIHFSFSLFQYFVLPNFSASHTIINASVRPVHMHWCCLWIATSCDIFLHNARVPRIRSRINENNLFMASVRRERKRVCDGFYLFGGLALFFDVFFYFLFLFVVIWCFTSANATPWMLQHSNLENNTVATYY